MFFLLPILLSAFFSLGALGITTEVTVTAANIQPGVGCGYGTAVGSEAGFDATIYSYPNSNTIIWSTFSPDGFNTAFLESSYELSGYFLAEETGLYTFELTDIDDAALVWFGDGLSCCDPQDLPSVDPVFGASWVSNGDINGAGIAYIYMEAGSYYPVRITFCNWDSEAALQFQITTPQQVVITDFADSVFQFANIDGQCTSSTVSFPFSTVTTTSGSVSTTYAVQTKTTNSAGVTVTTTEVLVVVPTSTLSTTTEPWTGTFTSTFTSTFTTTNSAGLTVTTTEVFVETPTPTLSTTTQPWTGTFTSTFTSTFTTTNSAGHTVTTTE
ncbi:DEKNAAC104775, partial [Brettanomyces naardenensis]